MRIKTKFTSAFGAAAAAAMVYMVAPLPSAGAAILNYTLTVTNNDSNDVWKLELIGMQDDYLGQPDDGYKWTESNSPLNGAPNVVATLNGDIIINKPMNDASEGHVLMSSNNEIAYFNAIWDSSQLTREEIIFLNWASFLGAYTDITDQTVPETISNINWINDRNDLTFERTTALAAAEPVPEPGFILGFITLASFMLGSRKKKEAKKT